MFLKLSLIIFISLLITPRISIALTPLPELNELQRISLAQYLQIVKENNAIIGNRKLAIDTATAIKQSLALYQLRPSVSYTKGAYYLQVPYTPYTSPTSNTYGLNFNIEGWGKRAARSEYGDAEINRSQSDYVATEYDIQTAATLGFIDALRNRLLLESYESTANKISKLKQTSEAKDSALFLSYYQKSTAIDLKFTSLSLLNYGGDALKSPPIPLGKLNISPQEFNSEELINQALIKRADVLLMQSAVSSSEKNISMMNANRNWDILPFVSYTTTPQYDSSGYTYMPQNGFSAGVMIPIPVNNYLQNADIVQAANQKLGLELQLRDLKTQVRVQVMQSLLQYESAKGILAQSNDEFDSILRVANLNTVKGIMDVREKEAALIDAQANHAKALINVWRQSGNYSLPKI